MAKNMALVSDGVVINVIWCSDTTADTDSRIAVGDRPVTIGDTYIDGKFYRGCEEVLAPLEDAQKKIAEYEQALSEIEAALGVS